MNFFKSELKHSRYPYKHRETPVSKLDHHLLGTAVFALPRAICSASLGIL